MRELMFHKIYQFTHKWEGGYSNHPADPGGSTNYGITQNTLNAYNKKHDRPFKNVKDLQIPEAIEIYYDEYWKPEWKDLGFPLAACMFDTAVNMGHSRADKFLKNCNGSYVEYLQLRIAKYKELVERHPRLKVFENGWMNRVADLRRFIEVEKDGL
jgi:lysozyme family protein